MEVRERKRTLGAPMQTDGPLSDRPEQRCLTEPRNKSRHVLSTWLMRFLTISVLCLAIFYVQGLVPRRNVPVHPAGTTVSDVSVKNQFNLTILTPDLQNVQTSKLILGNGLKAYIVSDPGIVKAGAALSVETGAWRDPPGVSGLGCSTSN
jgi:hypothetical protein